MTRSEAVDGLAVGSGLSGLKDPTPKRPTVLTARRRGATP